MVRVRVHENLSIVSSYFFFIFFYYIIAWKQIKSVYKIDISFYISFFFHIHSSFIIILENYSCFFPFLTCIGKAFDWWMSMSNPHKRINKNIATNNCNKFGFVYDYFFNPLSFNRFDPQSYRGSAEDKPKSHGVNSYTRTSYVLHYIYVIHW